MGGLAFEGIDLDFALNELRYTRARALHDWHFGG